MQEYVKARSIRADGLFMLGDNFYGTMDGGVASPRWKDGFEDMYPADVFPVRVGPCSAIDDYDENFHKVAANSSPCRRAA